MKRNTKLTLKFFVSLVRKHKLVVMVMIFALIIGVLTDLAWVVIVREFFDILVSEESKQIIVNGLIGTLIWLMISEGIAFVAWRVAGFLNNFFQTNVMSNISNECFSYMQRHSYRFFSNNFAGALVKKVNRLVRAFENIADDIYWEMIPMGLKISLILGILFYVHFVLGTILLIWCVIFIVANYLIARYKWKYDVASAGMDTAVTASLADTITNATNITLFSAFKYEFGRFKKVTEKWRKVTKKAWDVSTWVEAGQAGLMIILEFVILYAAILLWQRDLIEVADFFLIQAYLFEIFHQLWGFGRNLRNIYEGLADSEEMIVIMNTPHEVEDLKGAKNLIINSGKIEFKDVRFSYDQGGEGVLKNLNFKVKDGEKIALIGPSGGGKSTVVKLLLRLFDINKGRILIGGKDISEVRQDSLRSQIALVPQDPILFHRSLMDNIRYGRRNAPDKEVIAAAKLAHCHEFITKFPKGYDTFVGERGVKLSGGQRQRVAIARAILSNAKILILDEATSSLDSESEALIQDALDNLFKQKTALIIAHRLSTIMNVDRIFVLDKGRIVEEGDHAALVAQKDGVYKKLWDFQVGGYL